MFNSFIVVDGLVPTELDDTNLRDDPWSIALDQRAFGPRQLFVAFADDDGTFRGLAYTERRDPIDDAFEACLVHLGAGAAVAIAYCDEPVDSAEPSEAFLERYERMKELSADHGVRLVDWIACDDQVFRSTCGASTDGNSWWDLDRWDVD